MHTERPQSRQMAKEFSYDMTFFACDTHTQKKNRAEISTV